MHASADEQQVARRQGAGGSHLALVAAVVGVIVGGLVVLGLVAARVLPERVGPPVESLVVERTVLTPSEIALTLRNDGPDPVTVAQVSVNDSFADFSGVDGPIDRLGSETLRIDYPWQDGMPYHVSMLTSSGAVIEHEIAAAVATPETGAGSLARVALIGVLIGVVPVLLGMAFLPLLRRVTAATSRVLMAFTVGLLGFLAADATVEGLELGAEGGGAFGGPVLLVLGAALAWLALTAVTRWMGGRGRLSTGPRLALLVAIGIGLHNLGEGLAVGSAFAVGELALGVSLVVGFALHNTTEGIAIVAPLREGRVGWGRFVALALVAGAPAAVGTVVGATFATPAQARFLLGLGVGAIVQVVGLLAPQLRSSERAQVELPVLGGLAAGVLVMYLTGLLVAA